MIDELLFRGALPSARMLFIGMGAVIAVISAVLVQAAARAWLYQHRAQRRREHLERVETRWHEAA
jgi:hypothetical protein